MKKSRSVLHISSTPGNSLLDQPGRFRIYFTDLPKKNLSDDSEMRDPTIMSQKPSRLSQFSQINQRPSFPQEQQPMIEHSMSQTNQTKQQTKLPENDGLNEIVRKFWDKLKLNARILTSKQSLLVENYLKSSSTEITNFNWYLFKFTFFLELLSYITVPLGMNSYIPLSVNLFVLLLLFLSYIIQSLIAEMTFELIEHLLVDTLGIVILFQFKYEVKVTLLIIAVILEIHIHKDQYLNLNLTVFVVSELIYQNLIANIYIQVKDISYTQGVTYGMANSIPFSQGIGEADWTNIVVQFISFIVQIQLVTQYAMSFNRNDITIVKDYLNLNKVQCAVQDKVAKYITNLQVKEMNRNLKAINSLMQMLPQDLQSQVNGQIKGQILQNNPFLKQYFTPNVITYLSEKAHTLSVEPNQQFLRKGSHDDNVYILFKGQVQVYGAYDQVKHLLSTIENESIGFDHLLSNCGHNFTYESLGYCLLMKISHNDFREALRYNQKDLEVFYQLKQEFTFNKKSSVLLNSCWICKEQDHLLNECPYVHHITDRQLLFDKYHYSRNQQRRKQERFIDYRIGSLINQRLVKDCGERYRQNHHLRYDLIDEDMIDEEQIDYEQYIVSSKDVTNPSSNMQIEKSKSVEMISGQTLRDLPHEHQFLEADDSQELQHSRNQAVKQTIQTAGFQPQDESHFFGQEIVFNVPNQHKTITQNSNTFKSSSGQNTYQSQKSQQQRQQKQQQLSAPPRNQEPKLTFQYSPQPQMEHKSLLAVTQHDQQFRIQNRASTEKPLPPVSEESQLNLPFASAIHYQQAFPSAVSVSSIGVPSIDDNIPKNNRQTSIARRLTQPKASTYSSAISPGKLPSSSNNEKRNKGSGTYSHISSNRFQYQSDFEIGQHGHLFKDEIEIDVAQTYKYFNPMYNLETVVTHLQVKKLYLNK